MPAGRPTKARWPERGPLYLLPALWLGQGWKRALPNPTTWGQGSPLSTGPPPHPSRSRLPAAHLLHCRVPAGELLAEVCDVVVTLLHVLLEVLPEIHQGLLDLAVKLRMGGGGGAQDPRAAATRGDEALSPNPQGTVDSGAVEAETRGHASGLR